MPTNFGTWQEIIDAASQLNFTSGELVEIANIVEGAPIPVLGGEPVNETAEARARLVIVPVLRLLSTVPELSDLVTEKGTDNSP